MSRPWDPMAGKQNRPWNGDPFGPGPGSGPAPYRGAQDPFAVDPFQVPAAGSAWPAPARGGTGRYRVMSGLRKPTTGPVYGSGYRQPQDPFGADPFQVPSAPVAPWAPPAAAPQPQWGYPGGPGYRPFAPSVVPTKRPVLPLAVAAAVLLLAVVAATALVAVTVKNRPSRTASGPVSSNTATTSSRRTTTTSWRSTVTTTRRTTTSTTTTKTTPTGTAALQDNPIFADADAGLAEQICDPTGFPGDAATGQTFFDSVTPCLEKAWKPLVQAAGLGYRAPAVVVPTGTVISSPCGTQSMDTVVAFYCSGNQTLYMPIEALRADVLNDRPLRYISTFAHEFGHHVQYLIGTMATYHQQRTDAGRDSAAGLELSRRLELQAQCFAGMFVGSISDTGGVFTRADYDEIAASENRNEGTKRDHGTPQHQQAWWQRGGATDQVGQCNTWLAAATDVS